MPRRLTIRLPRPIGAVRPAGGGQGDAPAPPAGGEQTPAALRVELDAERQRLQQARRALQDAAGQLDRLRQDLLKEAEAQLVDLAVNIAAKILAQEIQAGRYEIEPIVAEALKGVPPRQEVVVHLHPDDFAACRPGERDDGDGACVRFVSDPDIRPAECIIETPEGIVEAAVETQLNGAAEVLKALE